LLFKLNFFPNLLFVLKKGSDKEEPKRGQKSLKTRASRRLCAVPRAASSTEEDPCCCCRLRRAVPARCGRNAFVHCGGGSQGRAHRAAAPTPCAAARAGSGAAACDRSARSSASCCCLSLSVTPPSSKGSPRKSPGARQCRPWGSAKRNVPRKGRLWSRSRRRHYRSVQAKLAAASGREYASAQEALSPLCATRSRPPNLGPLLALVVPPVSCSGKPFQW
jgi:hypothetical protein